MSRKNTKVKQNGGYLFEAVLDILKHNHSKTLNYKQIGSMLEVKDEDQRLNLIEVLQHLREQNFITEKEPGKFQYRPTETFVTGTIDVVSSGAAYVVTTDNPVDIYIPKGKTKDAFNGDTVQVLLTFADKRKREGSVQKVIQRKRTDFVGTAQVNKNTCFIVPDNHKLHVDFFIPHNKTKGIKDGQKALIQLINWNPAEPNPIAEVTEVLGYPGSHTTEMHAIMAEYSLPDHFPEEVEAAAKSIPTKITEDEIKRRRDFRDITTFTIDPYDAKDFDDALSYKKLENGNVEVGVHIADVTHYVKPGSIIDKEALERATSVYLVDRVIPMLPEILSNFVCSLRPKEEKLCFSAVFELDKDANIVNEWFGRTVIYSDRRFTYEEVQEIIEGAEGDFREEILALDTLAKKLRAERTKNGSIFFDKEEVKFKLDEEGKPIGILFKVQKDAHKLIEDFMLLANKQVATVLSKNLKVRTNKADGKNTKHGSNVPAVVYRVHDTPASDKLADLSAFVGKFGYGLNVQNKKSTVQSINKLLKDVKGKPEEGTISILAIRSMPKAIYTTDNIGHYGLGFDYYTHFTSPIRRYPDMMVHRLLEAFLAGKRYSNQEELETFSKHSSAQEKLAAEAERASIKYKQVEFLKDKVGQLFPAIISGVTEWGLYAEIVENRCEGLIRARDMKDDYYVFDEDNYCYIGKRTHKKFSLGDKVMIEVKNADMMKKQLDFLLVDTMGEGDHSDHAPHREWDNKPNKFNPNRSHSNRNTNKKPAQKKQHGGKKKSRRR